MLVLTGCYVVAYIDRVVLGLLIEPIRKDLAINDTMVSLLGGAAFALFYVTLGLPFGRMADRTSRRNLIAGGIFAWSIMTAFCGLAANFWQLFLARVGVGVGEAALTPAAHSMISDLFAPRRRSAALGTYMIGLAAGSGIAYIGGGALIQWITATDFSLPLLDTLRPWQTVFVLAALPGLLLCLLMTTVREPLRRERRADATQSVPLREVGRFVFMENGKTFGSIFIAFAGLALYGAALLLWLPAHMQRSFGWDQGRIGLTYGLIILVFATIGMVGGARLGRWLIGRGHRDGLMRAPLIMSAVMAPLGIAATLMPGPVLTLVLVAPVTMLSIGLIALVPGILQAVTPNEMRGQIGALFSFFNNAIGLLIGGTLVAVLTDFLFGDPRALGRSLALTAVIFLPASVLLLRLGLPHYRRSLTAAEAWT